MRTLVYRLNSYLVIGSLLVFIFGSVNVNALVDNYECKNISVVFLRGSGQNNDSKGLNDTLDSDFFGKFEPQSYAFFDGINKRTPNVSKEFISFHNSYQWR
jgi:hypothetical protein